MNFASPFTLAFLAGAMPPLVWLWFWLHEDRHPEPRRLVALAFIAGIAAIPVALLFEWVVKDILQSSFGPAAQFGLAMIILAAAIEEISKWALVRGFLFHKKEYDEPVDAMIYLVTGALGFAAGENILYLSTEFERSFRQGLMTGNLRFIGSTLLHAIASGIAGYLIARAFSASPTRKRLSAAAGLFLASVLHALFNISIIVSQGERIEFPLVLLGGTGLFLLWAFERIKKQNIYVSSPKKIIL
ncbi:MAG: PrsW family intramembrane metalloprotease [Patescibacteria group bacterium]